LTATFSFLFNKIWKYVNGLSDRPMSRAANETLLKAVIQAIPTYVMSCFQLPIATCDKIKSIIANRWWGLEDGRKKMHWRSWDWLSTPKALGGMGFRDLAIFNQAMLAKQGWRLLTDPNSLCARVLKGRYFPDTDFWNAPKPRSSSFTWRSILYGRELLAQGVTWGIGDGKTVKILSDNWVPNFPPSFLKPKSPIPASATVHCLMDEETGLWNLENVNAFFEEDAAKQILKVPIASFEGGDYACWPHTRHGTYSVRSAYNLARSSKKFHNQSKSAKGLHSGWTANEKDWKAIWNIKAPGKMKIHIWRFVHDCLPSGVQLVKRHIPADGACVFCGRTESIEHSLLFCQFARTVWREIKQHVPLRLDRKFFASCKQWLFDFFGRSSELQRTALAVGFWHIWEARNESRNSEAKPNPIRTVGKVLAYVDLIRTHLTKPGLLQRCEPSSSASSWVPPPPGTVLVSSDAAIFEASRSMGAGVLIRNHLGDFLRACREHMDVFPEPEYAEALALRRAVSLAREEGYDRVTFASDCLSLIQRLNSSVLDRSSVGILVAEVKHMTKSFSSVSFCHVKRNLNEAAHILAKTSLFSSCFFDSVPDCIRGTSCTIVF
jgi:hypothetical protein